MAASSFIPALARLESPLQEQGSQERGRISANGENEGGLTHSPSVPDSRLGMKQICARRGLGSAALLDGLYCRVLCPHPIIKGWVKIRLAGSDAELASRSVLHREWSISEDGLM